MAIASQKTEAMGSVEMKPQHTPLTLVQLLMITIFNIFKQDADKIAGKVKKKKVYSIRWWPINIQKSETVSGEQVHPLVETRILDDVLIVLDDNGLMYC